MREGSSVYDEFPQVFTDTERFSLFCFLVEQLTNVVLYSSDTYAKPVCTEEFGWGFLCIKQDLYAELRSFQTQFD